MLRLTEMNFNAMLLLSE